MKTETYASCTRVLLTSFVAIICVSLSHTSLTAAKQAEPKKSWCIVGGNRSIGYALAQNLCNDATVDCTLFVRNEKKTAKLFKDVRYQPTIVEGDIATDLELLLETTATSDYIVIAQTFPYKVWEECFTQMMINCIAAAQASNATIVYFGRIQRYGMLNPITETSVAMPNCEQGRIMDEMESLLENSLVNSVIITHSYPFGPESGDGLLEENFENMPKNGEGSSFKSKYKFKWIAGDAVKLQFAYTPDLATFARTFIAAPHAHEAPCVRRCNFAGITVANISEFAKMYYDITAHGKTSAPAYDPAKNLDLLKSTSLSIAAAFNPEARRAKDAYYSFENELLLSNTYQEAVCPFTLTPLATALQETYNAYTKK
jgi:nucleoside-diphosphate-sugar epimerase